jgi:hypothetical protein
MAEHKTILKIAETLTENANRIIYGDAAVTLKVHAGRIVSVIHSVTENVRSELALNSSASGSADSGTK